MGILRATLDHAHHNACVFSGGWGVGGEMVVKRGSAHCWSGSSHQTSLDLSILIGKIKVSDSASPLSLGLQEHLEISNAH